MFGLLKRKTCSHRWQITEISNVLQTDDMGYPLRLCIERCMKCGKSHQVWIDVDKKELDNDKNVICEWKRVHVGKDN